MTRQEYRVNLAVATSEVLTRIKEVIPQVLDLLFKKNLDYVPEGSNPFINFEKSAQLSGIDGAERVLISRLAEKFQRLENLLNSNKPPQVEDDSIQDTLTDIAGYAVIGKVMIKYYHKLNEDFFMTEDSNGVD